MTHLNSDDGEKENDFMCCMGTCTFLEVEVDEAGGVALRDTHFSERHFSGCVPTRRGSHGVRWSGSDNHGFVPTGWRAEKRRMHFILALRGKRRKAPENAGERRKTPESTGKRWKTPHGIWQLAK